MRVLLFTYSLRCGGAERVTANLANYWAGRGWEVSLITLAAEHDDFYALRPVVKRVAMGMAGESGGMFVGLWQNIRRVRALRRMLREINPEVAVAMLSTASIVLAFAAFGMTRLTTIGAEHSYPPRMPMGFLWEWLRRIAYGQLSAVTALTSECAVWLRAHTWASHVAIIPNVASWPLPVQSPIRKPDKLVPDGTRVLLSVGRLSEEKQLDHLVRAFGKLADEHSHWVLVFVGDGPLRGVLETQARALNVQDRVLFIGRVGNVGDWYARADLYAMTSRFEGFPNTLAEAMAYGLPAISYDCDTGPRDLIRDGMDGVLVPPNDPAALSLALGKLMGDDALRATFARRAVDVRDRYSQARIAAMWEKLFADLRT